jgi:hypothetical protein
MYLNYEYVFTLWNKTLSFYIYEQCGLNAELCIYTVV